MVNREESDSGFGYERIIKSTAEQIIRSIERKKHGAHNEVAECSREFVQEVILKTISDDIKLILSELTKTQAPLDQLEIHRSWLVGWHERVSCAIDEHKKQRERLIAMFGADADLGVDMINRYDIHDFSDMYKKSQERHSRVFSRLLGSIERMRSVQDFCDVGNLRGIGDRKTLKILKNIKSVASVVTE